MVFAGGAAPFAGTSAGGRLGTASGPFGVATAVADFDRDGRPDLAVADRVTRRSGKTYYDLEIELSTGRSEELLFSSDQPALDVRVADIDADGDLDIVLTPVLQTVAAVIWLNRGDGQFDKHEFAAGAAPILPAGHIRHSPPRLVHSLLALPVRSGGGHVRWFVPATLAPPLHPPVPCVTLFDGHRKTFDRSSLAARAPPFLA